MADFSRLRLRELGKDRVDVHGASGTPRPPALKAMLGHRAELIGVDAMHGCALGGERTPYEVRVRLAVRCTSRAQAERVGQEVTLSVIASGSLALDAHGKTLSAAILDIEIDDPNPPEN